MIKPLVRLRCVLYKADPDFIELWCGVLTFMLGAFFLLPMETFSSHGVYSGMGRIMNEDWRGVLFISVGMLKVLCYLVGNLTQRRYCLFIMAILWTFMTVTILTQWADRPYSAAPIMFGFITLAIVWAFLRVGVMRTVRENLYGNRANSG